MKDGIFASKFRRVVDHCLYLHALFFALNGYTDCFIVKENNVYLIKEGQCAQQHTPACTFNIAISLMSYNENILQNESLPKVPYSKKWEARNKTQYPHTPSLWMKNSAVWFSRHLTHQLGIQKFAHYVKLFNYGNLDVSGDKGKNNSLSDSWESSSLEISGLQQMKFLDNFLNNQLPVSSKAHEMTKKILLLGDFLDGWRLYAKTGSGYNLSKDRSKKLHDQKKGWFVGWLQKKERKILFVQFVQLIADENQKYSYGSTKAKKVALEKLKKIVNKSH